MYWTEEIRFVLEEYALRIWTSFCAVGNVKVTPQIVNEYVPSELRYTASFCKIFDISFVGLTFFFLKKRNFL